jgi:Mn-dependent DtxR family transcriptional regulator
MTSLRPSQVETLKAVARHEDEYARGPGAAPATVARTLGRQRDSVEESLAKLEERGYVRAIFYPLLSAVYVLTDTGKQVMGEGR